MTRREVAKAIHELSLGKADFVELIVWKEGRSWKIYKKKAGERRPTFRKCERFKSSDGFGSTKETEKFLESISYQWDFMT